jgi:multiple sugar transport system permease protein
MSQPSENTAGPGFYAIVTALAVMAVGPILLMFVTSLKLNVDIMNDTAGLLFVPTMRNYEAALCGMLWYAPDGVDVCNPAFGRSLINSLIVGASATVITLVLGAMAAYALVRYRFVGREGFGLSVLVLRMIPPAVLLVPVFGIWSFQFCIGNARRERAGAWS